MVEVLKTIKHCNEPLFYFGFVSLIGAIITGILTQTTTNEVLGINAYYKPMKFFISTVLFVWTMAFYMQYLNNKTSVTIFNWIAIIGLGYELFAITLQATRGKISHYNMETSLDSLIFSLMAMAVTIVMLGALYIGILFFSQSKFDVSMVIIWSIRLSIVLTVIFAFEGFVMGSYLKHTVGAEDGTKGLPVVNWSKTHGDLRIAHFLGLHAIQVLPFICYYIAKNTAHVFIIAAVYLVLVTATLIQALMGRPLI